MIFARLNSKFLGDSAYMTPKIHFKIVINEYISTGLVMGYSVFYLKCICNNIILFKFLHKRSSSIYCDRCNRLAYKLIYHNKFKITIRRYFNDKYKDYDLKNDTENRFKTRVKGQHELSQMYLKNFCVVNTDNIFVYNKKVDNVKRRNIQSFSRKPFLYDKEAPQLAEQFLSLIENDTSPYLSEIITNNKIFNTGDSTEVKDYKRTLLLRFMILLHLRRRSVKKFIYDKLLQFDSEDHENLIFDNIKFENEFKMRDDNGRKTYNNLVQHFHRLLMRAAISQEQYYDDYRIKLLINKSSTPFITSDNPVIKIDSIERKGISIPSKIYFPISLNHYILLIHPNENQSSIKKQLNEKEVHKLNYWQYSCSNKYVISNLQNIKKYIKKISEVRITFLNLPLCFFGFRLNNSNHKFSLFI